MIPRCREAVIYDSEVLSPRLLSDGHFVMQIRPLGNLHVLFMGHVIRRILTYDAVKLILSDVEGLRFKMKKKK